MLKALHIRNVVLIDHLALEFSSGLAALTGETGAGKSILLDSLGLALGGRADAGLVRRGTDQASVTVEFDLDPKSGHPVFALLAEHGLTSLDQLILRRVLGADGRSRAYVNDESVSVGLLKSIGESLVDIHGQFETYGLLNPSTHRSVLDRFCGKSDLVSNVSGAFSLWRASLDKLSDAEAQSQEAARSEAYLRDCVRELEELSPEEGEEDALLAKKKALQNLDALRGCYASVLEGLGGEQGADIQIGQAWRQLDRMSDKIGSDLTDVLAALDRASQDVQLACQLTERLASSLDLGGLSLEEIEDRLYALRGAARKFQCRCDELPARLLEMSSQLQMIDGQGDLLSRLQAEVQQNRAAYIGLAEELHERRAGAAGKLDQLVQKELKPLKLEKALFRTAVDRLSSEALWNSHGFDDVRFEVSTNSGRADAVFGPLNKIASGGEMARFMLALKVVLAESLSYQGVYVFDEIDTGIGGATANAVGERLASLAAKHQVMVVTHSPQVAARADYHWMVSKSGGTTEVVPLTGEERREEIARMLAGAEITHEARAAAARLIELG